MPEQARKFELNEQTEIWMDALDVAMPLYTRAHFGKLRACVDDVAAGRDLGKTVEGKSPEWVEYAAGVALRAGEIADRALMAELEDLIVMPFDDLDDFSLITLAQVLFERNPGQENDALSKKMHDRNAEALYRVFMSEKGCPLVDYEWIGSDMVQYSHVPNDVDELDILKRNLKNFLYLNNVEQAMENLRHMGALHLECGELEDGCRVYAELITSDPLDFENYYDVSLLAANLKHYDLSLKAAERARQMLRITRSNHEMADHLAFSAEMTEKYSPKEEARLDGNAEAPLRKALEIGFMRGTHLTIEELARRIVPEIDTIPVKEIPLF